MIISMNWLSEIVDLKSFARADALAALLTGRGFEVERVMSLSQGFESVITARILKRDRHPNADRLSLCLVDDGRGNELEIVCGAQNMKAGDVVALAQIGALLPNGVKIERSKIRDVVSNGMLCSEAELGMSAEADGILILPPDTELGQPLAEVLGRDDVLLELSLPANRGDILSHLGIAREVAAALGTKLAVKTISKNKKAAKTVAKAVAMPYATATIAEGPQFLARLVEGVSVGPSPAWLKTRLEAIGERSINGVVDVTNLVLFELGQPSHAYDADRLPSPKLSIRKARAGEKLELLDDTTVALTGSELVIASGDQAVALAGVMGGKATMVTSTTKRIVIEVAEFDPKLTRATAQRLGKRSESSRRFERGIDPDGLNEAIDRLSSLMTEVAGGAVAGTAVSRQKKTAVKPVPVDATSVSEKIGVVVAPARIKSVATSMGCKVSGSGAKLKIVPPAYRRDLQIEEDFVEEVARSIGFDKIPSTVPVLTSPPSVLARGRSGVPTSEAVVPTASAIDYSACDRVRDAMMRAGFHESVQYAFGPRSRFEAFGISPTVRVENPMSEDQEWMVPSLVPGILEQLRENVHRQFGSDLPSLRFFELRPTFHLRSGQTQRAISETETPVDERWSLVGVLQGNRQRESLQAEAQPLDFFDIKGTLETVFELLGTKGGRIQAVLPQFADRLPACFHPGIVGTVMLGKDVGGYLGRLNPRFEEKMKLRRPTWLFEVDAEALMRMSRASKAYPTFQNWSDRPAIERDFALVVKDPTEAHRITQIAMTQGRPLAKHVKVFDIYRGPQIGEGMTSIAVRVIFYSDERSLLESEADEASARIIRSWKEQLGAILRS